MDTNDIAGLVSVVSVLGWRPNLKQILGTDADAFYSALVAHDPTRAYQVAQQSGDIGFIRAVTGHIIKSAGFSDNLEAVVSELYLPSPVQSLPASVQSQFSIESLDDKYRIHGVMYQGSVHTVDVSKALLDDGARHTQSRWIEMTRQGEWKLASGPLYFAVMSALYDNREHSTQKPLVEEVRAVFAGDFERYFMLTSTNVYSTQNNLESVTHDAKFSTRLTDLVGPNGYLNQNPQFREVIESLVGIDNCDRIHQIGNWVTGKDSYLSRMRNRIINVERTLVLGNDTDKFSICVDVDTTNIWCARGFVARVAENSP